jgi:prepilin-type N-terminal cleavage/methylation domain-containing protein
MRLSRNHARGVTLVELLVAATIILILAAIIVTALVKIRKVVLSLGGGHAEGPPARCVDKA